jgi:DNA-binding CsgD family transcriptional regulator/PAS domain-containing protein
MTIAVRNTKSAAPGRSTATLAAAAEISPLLGADAAANASGPERTSALPARKKPASAIEVRRASGPIQGEEQLSALIGEIYDAAMQPALWPSVLAQTADFVGGSAAALFCKDAATKQGNVYYDCGGTDPRYKQLYFEDYIKIDPSTAGHCFAEIGKPIGIGDILDFEEFHHSRFYQEWVRPQQLADNVSVALDKSATGAALFAVFRHEWHGRVDEAARRRMTLIAPHVRRAALVGRAIGHKAAEAATFADTLDGLGAGMVLVDAAGRIVHANAAGQAMLAQGAVLRSANGRLAATDVHAGRALQEVVAAASGGDAMVGSRGVAVPLAGRDGERYVAHALPLTSAERRRAGASYAAVAALFVQKAALEGPSAPEAIAKTFGLTPTELRVLLAIVDTGGVPETADALGIGQATVKTHLHRLFRKTATARQTELVKLVAGFSSPLAA